MNLEIIGHLEIMHQLNYPVLLGTSRKSVIGLTLDLPADERVEGTNLENGDRYRCFARNDGDFRAR